MKFLRSFMKSILRMMVLTAVLFSMFMYFVLMKSAPRDMKNRYLYPLYKVLARIFPQTEKDMRILIKPLGDHIPQIKPPENLPERLREMLKQLDLGEGPQRYKILSHLAHIVKRKDYGPELTRFLIDRLKVSAEIRTYPNFVETIKTKMPSPQSYEHDSYPGIDKVLINLEEHAVPELIKALDGHDPFLRAYAAVLLGKIRDNRATDALKEALAYEKEDDEAGGVKKSDFAELVPKYKIDILWNSLIENGFIDERGIVQQKYIDIKDNIYEHVGFLYVSGMRFQPIDLKKILDSGLKGSTVAANILWAIDQIPDSDLMTLRKAKIAELFHEEKAREDKGREITLAASAEPITEPAEEFINLGQNFREAEVLKDMGMLKQYRDHIAALLKPFGHVAEKDFSKIVDDEAALLKDLIMNGYVDNEGFIQERFWDMEEAGEMDWDAKYSGHKQDIFDIIHSKKRNYSSDTITSAIITIGALRAEEFFSKIEEYLLDTASYRLDTFEKPVYSSVRLEAAKTLKQFQDHNFDRYFDAPDIKDLSSSGPIDLILAADEIEKQKKPEAISDLEKLLGHENPAVRLAAVLAVGSIGGEQAVDVLASSGLEDTHKKVRLESVNMLGNLEDARASMDMTKALNVEKLMGVRFAIASALAKIDYPIAIRKVSTPISDIFVDQLYPICGKVKIEGEGRQQRCGYINREGKIIIGLKYGQARPFHEGVAWVNKYPFTGVCGRSAYRLIDHTGLSAHNREYYEVEDFRNGVTFAQDGRQRMFVNKEGATVLDLMDGPPSCEFNPLRPDEMPPRIEKGSSEFSVGDLKVQDLRNSLQSNRQDNEMVLQKLGLTADTVKTVSEDDLVKALNAILPTRDFYSNIAVDSYKSFLDNEMRNILNKAQANDTALTDQDYKRLNRGLLEAIYPETIFPLIFHEIEQRFVEARRREYSFDENGDVIFHELEGTFGRYYSEGLVQYTDSSQKIGYVDKDDFVVIEPQFVKAGDFHEGLAAVSTGEKQQDNKRFIQYGYINRNGEMVIEEQFSSAFNFSEGVARVTFGKLLHGYRHHWAFIDKTGKILFEWPDLFHDVSDFHEGLAKVRMGSFYGYIDKIGEFVIGAQFDKAGDFKGGLAQVERMDRGSAYINREGKYIFREDEFKPDTENLQTLLEVEKKEEVEEEREVFPADSTNKIFEESESSFTYEQYNRVRE